MKRKSIFSRGWIFIVIFVLGGVFSLAATDEPKVKKGADVTIVSGSLVNWQDVQKTKAGQLEKARRMRPVMNFANPKKLVRPSRGKDTKQQKTFRGDKNLLGRHARGMTPVRDFAGLSFLNNGSGWPPDTCGDVGPTYYIQTVNTSIGIFDKTTGELISATTYDAFFPSSLGDPCDQDNNGDVNVLYDKFNQRWFLLDFSWIGTTNGSYFSIAASKTADPRGEWWTYCLQADVELMDDYPKCGVWHDGIYITANMFKFGGNFQNAKIWALKIPEIYNGTLIVQSVTDNDYYAWSILPSNAKGPTAPPSDAPNYLYAMDADEYGGISSDTLYAWKYYVDWDNSRDTTWTGPIKIEGVAPFGLTANQVPQQGTSYTLDSLYGRLMYPANYINYGTHESVMVCHLAESDNSRAMRWYEIRIADGNSSLYQQGTFAPDSHHRWMGSICGDSHGNIAMGYSVSSSSMYPAIRYCGRLSSDPQDIMAQGEVTLMEGGGYQDLYSRWGDYSHLTLDPVDNETFWYTQEFYASSGTNWQTRIGAFKLGGDSPPPVDDIKEAVDNNSLTFIKSGDVHWSKVDDVYLYDNDSAKSGAISHKQSSSIETYINISSEKELKFYWKVSSESNYDFLKLYIDGGLQSQVSGNVDWQQKSYLLSAGKHTLKWTYSKDVSISSGSDCGWVDKVELLDAAAGGSSLAKALDNETLVFNTSGDGDWFAQANTFYYKDAAAESPDLLDSQKASLETVITKYQTIKFHWKISSEYGYDLLQFFIDGVLRDQVSGNVDWQQKIYAVPAGTHTLKWTYAKDYSISSGSDCAWLDKLELDVAPQDPIGEALDVPKLIFTLSGDQEWTITTTDSVFDGDAVTVPAALFHAEEAAMETNVSGCTAIKFYWKVSSEKDYDYLKFYIDGILKDEISGEVEWESQKYSLSSGPHTLKWVYSKDKSVSSGADTAWVDKIELLE